MRKSIPGMGGLLVLSLALAFVRGADPVAAQTLPASKDQALRADQGEGWVRVAVIAASQKGMGGDRPLRYAYRDGERLEKMLGSVGQVDADNLFLLKVEGKAAFQDALARIGSHIADLKDHGRKVFLQFYYSGHGGARNFHFSDGKLSFDEVKQALGGDRADARVYVLDVCFGASFFTAKGFRTAPPVQLQMEMDQAAKGEVTISSSSLDEQAYEVRNLGGSIFTSQWIMALRGAGDRNRDGQVTLFEAYNYAYDRTSGYSAETLDRPQHPSYQIDLTGARDVMLARLLRSSTGILFKACPAGIYNLVDLQRGIQIGELRIPEGEDFTLALEPGKYRVQFQAGKGPSLAADVDLAAAAMTPLAFGSFLPQAPGSGIPKGSLESDAGGSDAIDLDGTEAPRVRGNMMNHRGLFNRLGYSAWYGMGFYRDAKLRADFDQVPEADRTFGLGGTFRMPPVRSIWGFDLTWSPTGAWILGARLGYSGTSYSKRARGNEPLHSPTDSLGGDFPVNLTWDYQFTDFQWGGTLGRNFQVTPSMSLTLDGSAAYIDRTLKGTHTVERTLFASTTQANETTSAHGFRVELGATWLKTLAAGPGGHPWTVGLRLAPYLSQVDQEEPNAGALRHDSHELGLAASLNLGLQGLQSLTRKPL